MKQSADARPVEAFRPKFAKMIERKVEGHA
jgi:hypothetical protein